MVSRFSEITTSSPMFASALEGIGELELPEIAQMSGCGCPPRHSPGADFLSWVLNRAVAGVRSAVDQHHMPRRAFATTNAQLVADVRRKKRGDEESPGFSDRHIRACFLDLSAWKVVVPNRQSSDFARGEADGIDVVVTIMKVIARTLANSIVDRLQAAYCALAAVKIRKRYSAELEMLHTRGYAPVVIAESDCLVIRVELGEIDGADLFADLSNDTPGLFIGSDDNDLTPGDEHAIWTASLYQRSPGNDPVDIFSNADSPAIALDNALTEYGIQTPTATTTTPPATPDS